MRRRWLAWMTVAMWACSGTAAVDGTGGGTTTSTTTATGCTDHSHCEEGVCVFARNQCMPTCTLTDPCEVGMVCSECATASCPTCRDCVAACMPASAGQCDHFDDCPSGWACLYDEQRCAPPCTSDGGCEDPLRTCEDCATSSCPGCYDCLAACVLSR